MSHMNCPVSMGIKYITTHFLVMSCCIKFRVLVNEPRKIHWRQPDPVLVSKSSLWSQVIRCIRDRLDQSHWLKVMVTLGEQEDWGGPFHTSHRLPEPPALMNPLPIVTPKSSTRNTNKAVFAPE